MAPRIAALFDTEGSLRNALTALRRAGIDQLCTYTPKPLEDEPAYSPLPGWVLLAGLTGAAGGFLMQVYAGSRAYPLDIGGRPPFSWPAYVPIAFELGVLCAVLTGVFGYFLINRMPRLYDPVDEWEVLQEAMSDGWLVIVTTGDTEQTASARELLRSHAPRLLSERES